MPPSTLISGCSILADGEFLKRGDLLLEKGKIRKIAPRINARGSRVVPGKGLVAAPGLIDTQINGGFGISFTESSPEQVLEVGRKLLKYGVTGYVPTVISQPLEKMRTAAANLAAAVPLKGGARILGIHLEGPFLSPARRGAHRMENLRLPSVEEFRSLAKAAGGHLRKMTLAPELPGALDVIREGARRGVIMSAGHSSASADHLRRAVREGVTHVTHIFNAMNPLHHREETLLGQALLSEGLSCGMIYDRYHLNAEAVRLLLRLKPREKLILVSDTTFALDAPDGEISADGERFIVKGGEIRVKTTGRLAGSAKSLLYGVRCLIDDLGMDVKDAVIHASGAPARLLGL